VSTPYFNSRLVSVAMHMTFANKTDKTVMMTLAKFANSQGVCWPGQQTLMDLIGCSESTLRRALRRLEDGGHIRKSRRHRPDGARRSDRYELISLMPTGHFDAQPTGHFEGGNSKENYRSNKEERPSDSLRSSGLTWDDVELERDPLELPGDRVADSSSERIFEETPSATRETVDVDEPLQGVLVVQEKSMELEVVKEDPAVEVGRRAWRDLFGGELKLTAGQRTDRLAKVYIGNLKGRKTAFHSVRSVVKTSVDAGRSNEEIAGALLRLAAHPDRILSVNVLEVEILQGGQLRKTRRHQEEDDLFARWDQRIAMYKEAGLA
jgi:hypothetical protein